MSDLERIEGLFVGQLNEREMRTFERAIKDGEACRSYDHFAAATLGLAKVKLIRALITEQQ